MLRDELRSFILMCLEKLCHPAPYLGDDSLLCFLPNYPHFFRIGGGTPVGLFRSETNWGFGTHAGMLSAGGKDHVCGALP